MKRYSTTLSDFPQLPLNIRISEEVSFDNYVAGENVDVVAGLQQQLSSRDESFIYLWGNSGVGCSHLLQAACQGASIAAKTSIYLPMDQILHLDVTILEGIETVDLVVIDHLESVVGDVAWEEALFHLFNRIKLRCGALLIAASQAPRAVGIKLPDLNSRLCSGITFQVHPLNEKGKLFLLTQRAHAQGLDLSDDAAKFILNRAKRGVTSLLEIVGRLERLSMSAKRKLTIPFIKDTMGW